MPDNAALLETPLLEGTLVRLEPLAERHLDGLSEAAAEGRAAYGFTLVPDGRDAMAAYLGQLLDARAAGEELPYAQVRLGDGRVVGATRYLTLRRRHGLMLPYAVEVGGTWLSASAQRSGINVEAKLLLLGNAFEAWQVGRVDLKTDARNARSRAAIEALGASFEGVLRHWQPSQVAGEEADLRDSALYSVLPAEWPQVRARLEERLRRGRPAAAVTPSP